MYRLAYRGLRPLDSGLKASQPGSSTRAGAAWLMSLVVRLGRLEGRQSEQGE